ncbi:FIG00448550: hypothetical protein, partial [Arthrobacter sp. DR-2P]
VHTRITSVCLRRQDRRGRWTARRGRRSARRRCRTRQRRSRNDCLVRGQDPRRHLLDLRCIPRRSRSRRPRQRRHRRSPDGQPAPPRRSTRDPGGRRPRVQAPV